MTMRNKNVTKPNSPGRHASSGFSLIELMVTVVIVSILASIAIPAYNAQIRKSRRTEAKTALLDLAGREERYFNTNSTVGYTNDPANLGYKTPPATMTNYPVGSGYYTVTINVVAAAPPAPATYQIVATPVGDQLNDLQCQSFTVTSTGAQTATSPTDLNASTDCWK